MFSGILRMNYIKIGIWSCNCSKKEIKLLNIYITQRGSYNYFEINNQLLVCCWSASYRTKVRICCCHCLTVLYKNRTLTSWWPFLQSKTMGVSAWKRIFLEGLISVIEKVIVTSEISRLLSMNMTLTSWWPFSTVKYN